MQFTSILDHASRLHSYLYRWLFLQEVAPQVARELCYLFPVDPQVDLDRITMRVTREQQSNGTVDAKPKDRSVRVADGERWGFFVVP